MLEDISVRDYMSIDYSQVISLWEQTSLGIAQRGDSHDIIMQSIMIGGKFIVAITPENEVVGTAWLTFDGRRIHLHHLGVKVSYQRKGIGDLLTLESLKFAKEKGYQIKLEVHQTNLPAINLYKKHGFNYLGDYDVYIVRDLDKI
jgi:ribosomal protein S18 acetylase RimI-like enzyme